MDKRNRRKIRNSYEEKTKLQMKIKVIVGKKRKEKPPFL
jgi:hypothetical protein